MSIGKICSRDVQLARADEPVLAAAVRMKAKNVGSLVVVDAHHRPIGILTDRDLVVRVLTEGRDAHTTKVETVMTHEPRRLPAAMPVEDALGAMRSLGVRRMPVIDERGELEGIVSVDDVLELLSRELANVSRVLSKGASGVLPPATGAMEAARSAAAG